MSYPSPPEEGDDSVFYDSDGEANNDIREFQQSANDDKEREVSRDSTDDSTNEHLESPGNQASNYRRKLHPLDLPIRLIPT